MYQVLSMKGFNEPWYQFEGWEEDILSRKMFSSKVEAVRYYRQLEEKGNQDYQYSKEKRPFQKAFWNKGDLKFCESCDEDLQVFYGLLLIEAEV